MSSVARSDLDVESRLLFRKSVWCGAVFSLAVLLTALNFVPPVDVFYRVDSQAMVSPERLEQLLQLAKEHESHYLSSERPSRIVEVRVLDEATEDAVNRSSNQPLMLVSIGSEWMSRTEESVLADWLDELTTSPITIDSRPDIARETRLARWEVDAHKHYVAQDQYLSEGSASNAAQRTTFELASFSNAAEGASADSEQTAAAAPDLQDQLAAAEQRLSETELAWRQEIQQSSGTLRVANAPSTTPLPSSIPMWMAASVLILGLSAGSAAGWIQHRLQSGGAYDPTFVSRQLALQGVPVAGEVQLSSDLANNEDWLALASRKASDASRRTARQLTVLSEWAVAFWCVVIVSRIVFDPMWRSVLIESPLAAFGRLISGMP